MTQVSVLGAFGQYKENSLEGMIRFNPSSLELSGRVGISTVGIVRSARIRSDSKVVSFGGHVVSGKHPRIILGLQYSKPGKLILGEIAPRQGTDYISKGLIEGTFYGSLFVNNPQIARPNVSNLSLSYMQDMLADVRSKGYEGENFALEFSPFYTGR